MKLRLREQIICCMLAVILLFTGMCVEIPHADASFLYAKEASATNPTGSVIREGSAMVKLDRICTISTLKSNVTTFLSSNRMRNPMKRIRDVSALFAAAMLLLYLFCFGRLADEVFGKLNASHDTIIRYIQQTDGKK